MRFCFHADFCIVFQTHTAPYSSKYRRTKCGNKSCIHKDRRIISASYNGQHTAQCHGDRHGKGRAYCEIPGSSSGIVFSGRPLDNVGFHVDNFQISWNSVEIFLFLFGNRVRSCCYYRIHNVSAFQWYNYIFFNVERSARFFKCKEISQKYHLQSNDIDGISILQHMHLFDPVMVDINTVSAHVP